MLELLLTTEGFEAITEILDDAGMFDTYDPLLRDLVARSAAAVPGGRRQRLRAIVSHAIRMLALLASHPLSRRRKSRR